MRPKRYPSLWYVSRKPSTYLALTLTPSPNGPNKIPHDPSHLGVPSGSSKTISVPTERSAKPCTDLASRLAHLQTDKNELLVELTHLGVPSGVS